MSIAEILTRLAGKISKVYDAGHTKGFADGVTDANEDFESEKETLSKSLAVALTSGDTNRMSLETNVNQARNDLINIRKKLSGYAIAIMLGQPSSTYPELIDDVHDMGYSEGESKGLSEGIEQGKQSAYDEFWDNYQSNGERVDYRSAFSGIGWTTKTFKPIYPIQPTMANAMFAYCNVNADLGKILKEQNISIDFSSISNADQLFHESKFTALPVIDLSGVRSGSLYLTFSYLNATKIEKIILKNDGSQSFNSSFLQSSKLAEVIFEGVIGQNFDMRYSPLTHDSLMSIINCLQDLSSGTTTRTLTIGSTNIAKLTDEEQEIARGKGWTLV